MKKNKGITMISLVITIVLIIIIAGISIGQGSNVIKQSQLENLKTNMMLIEVKAKEYLENANFKLGTNIDTATDKESRIENAKQELKGEIVDKSILDGKVNITENDEYTFFYKLTTEELDNMGISKVKSDEENGLYILKYDLKNIEIEVYNTKGFENDGKIYYALNDIQNLNI